MTITEAIQHAQWCLEQWDTSHSPSATGYEVEQIGPKHQLRLAMDELLPLMDVSSTITPEVQMQVRGHWARFLALVAMDDYDAGDEADRLWDALDLADDAS